MIKRIVQLTFREDAIEDFKKIFEESKDKIVNSKGCYSVELLQSKEKNIFFTFSIWESEDLLNEYRHSDLFNNTWAKTKQLFADKPRAWTTHSLHKLERD